MNSTIAWLIGICLFSPAVPPPWIQAWLNTQSHVNSSNGSPRGDRLTERVFGK